MESDNGNISLVCNTSDNHENKTRKFKLEPALVFVFFGWHLALSIIPNQLLHETCLSFGFNATDCSQIGFNGNATKEIEEKIQPHVIRILMTASQLTSIIPAILSLFIGPLTDKFGRKKAICASFFGHAASLGSFLLISVISRQWSTVNPWLYLLPYIPVVVVGGFPTMLLAVLCYTTDLSTEKNRSSRLALVEMRIYLGVLLGTTSSSYLLEWSNPTAVFLIATMCVVVASVYTITLVDESIEIIESASARTLVIDMIKTCFKRRPYKQRRILWCLMTILMFTVFTANGSSNVFYLFVREKFSWTLKEATLFNSLNILIAIIGCVIGLVFLKKRFGFSDISLAVIAMASTVAYSLLIATATNPTKMYMAACVCLFNCLVLPMCRSLISTIVAKNEIGKVYSVTCSFEAISSLIASPLYTYIYTQTFKFITGAFLLITAGVYCINLILLWYAIRMTRKKELLVNIHEPIDHS